MLSFSHLFISRAVQAFQMVLYREVNFCRAGDIHLRIGVIKKKKEDYVAANKVVYRITVSFFRLAIVPLLADKCRC